MGTANINQLMSEMRQLVVNLQNREKSMDTALTKSQIVNEKISGMKEYQEEVANMNGCWRMQGRKGLLAGLQQENRQILQLQQENRELRQTLEDYEATLQIVMQKHRVLASCFPRQPVTPIPTPDPVCETSDPSKFERLLQLARVLDKCFAKGEQMSNYDQEIIARLTTENACLRNLLNIAARNEPGIGGKFLNISKLDSSSLKSGDTTILNNLDVDNDDGRDGASTPKSGSQENLLNGSVKVELDSSKFLSSSPL